MDIRRTILWMIFSFSLLLLWNNWQVHNGKPSLFGGTPQTQNEPHASAANDSTPNMADADGSIPSAVAQNSANTASVSSVVESANIEPDISESETITVSTDVFSLTFDTVGAQIIRAELFKYLAPSDRDNNMLLFDRSPNHTYVAQTGAVGTDGKSYPNHLSKFEHISTERNGNDTVVKFSSENDGLQLTKIFTIKESEYAIKVDHEFHNTSNEAITPSVYLQLMRDKSDPKEASTFYRTFTGPAIYSQEEKFQKVSFSDIDKGKAKYAENVDNGWISMVQHYFATAWVPTQGVERTNGAVKHNNLYAVHSIQNVGVINPGETKTVNADLWVGPQDQKAMSDLAPGLELVVDYGWLTIISKPLFQIMTWIYALLGNWGWTIVVLTLLIKAVFYPLSAASYRSMAKMRQVTPRMQALREQHKDDRAKLNAAMMEMYRTEKINPLGGCLPMLVQIPVFIALYWVLLGSVEMRGAPWAFWIHDLSARDPWFILPAFMMATMFLQIKLNPTPPDPMQARVMMIMPLVFGGMMFFFPAGLVLYWCVNNAVSIIQQRYIIYRIEKDTAAAASS